MYKVDPGVQQHTFMSSESFVESHGIMRQEALDAIATANERFRDKANMKRTFQPMKVGPKLYIKLEQVTIPTCQSQASEAR